MITDESEKGGVMIRISPVDGYQKIEMEIDDRANGSKTIMQMPLQDAQRMAQMLDSVCWDCTARRLAKFEGKEKV